MLGITDDVKLKKNKNNKRKRRNVTFNDEECIINPEDVDPNVGRFRNLIQTTVVPAKRMRAQTNFMGYSASNIGATTSSGAYEFWIHFPINLYVFIMFGFYLIW